MLTELLLQRTGFANSLFRLALIFGASILSACAVSPTPSMPTATPKPMPAGFQERWLQGIPCALPCWEGITLGETTPAQAVAILEQNSLFTNVNRVAATEASKQGEISWNLANGQLGGRIATHWTPNGETIYLIGPYYTSTFILGNIIAKYGEPDVVVAAAQTFEPDAEPNLKGTGKQLLLVFESKGFAVGVAHIPKHLNPDMQVGHPIFFIPNDIGRQDAISTDPSFVSKWKGFKDYSYYCRDSEKGKACNADE